MAKKVIKEKEKAEFDKINYIDFSEKAFLEGGDIVNKYLPIDAALRILNDQELWFCNPVKWDDPFEKFSFMLPWKINDKFYYNPLIDNVFCICLANNIETDAHWKSYSGSNIAMELQLNRSELLNALSQKTDEYDIYITKMNYLPKQEVVGKIYEYFTSGDLKKFNEQERTKFLRLLRLKRKEFEHEEEIRIILVKKKPKNNFRFEEIIQNTPEDDVMNERFRVSEPGVNISFGGELKKLVERVIIGPENELHISEGLKRLFNKRFGYSISDDIKETGIVMRSPLYAKIDKNAVLEELQNEAMNRVFKYFKY